VADIVKKIDRLIPPTERTMLFDQTEISEGDILMVRESMGRPARSVVIDAVAELNVSFNVYHTVFPNRQGPASGINMADPLMHTDHLPNLAQGIRMDRSVTVAGIWIEAGESFEMDGSFATRDIKFNAVSGNFTVLLT